MNRESDPTYAAELWKCDGCGNLDTQSHIIWCPGFAPLREGLDIDNDKDVIHYFQEVFKLRETVISCTRHTISLLPGGGGCLDERGLLVVTG